MNTRTKDHESSLTADRLREVLRYDPETGDFYWRIAPKKRTDLLNERAGCQGAHYWMIRIDGRLFLAHRLAWLWMHGEWPPADRDIDHKDGTSSNQWSNLRLATKSQNMANSKVRSDSVSGLKGVSYCRATGQWAVKMRWEGRWIWLGRHSTKEAAKAVRDARAVQLHGAFARFQ